MTRNSDKPLPPSPPAHTHTLTPWENKSQRDMTTVNAGNERHSSAQFIILNVFILIEQLLPVFSFRIQHILFGKSCNIFVVEVIDMEFYFDCNCFK